MLMVKTGEVYTTTDLNEKNGFLHDVPERPRAVMNPCKRICGVRTAV
jgi:hypothetical protein